MICETTVVNRLVFRVLCFELPRPYFLSFLFKFLSGFMLIGGSCSNQTIDRAQANGKQRLGGVMHPLPYNTLSYVTACLVLIFSLFSESFILGK